MIYSWNGSNHYFLKVFTISMAKRLATIWKIDPHTQAKHLILKIYWQAWFPIMTRWNQRVLYIDGFAGPGVYEGGEKGSPVIVLETARDHIAQPENEVIFTFIEKDTARFEHLDSVIDDLRPTLPKNFKCSCIKGSFDETLTAVLNEIERANKTLAPAFVFVDPFGFSHTPFKIISRLMKNSKCEVFINFMYEEINRFISIPDQQVNYDELFGTDKWRVIVTIADPRERKTKLHDLYLAQLREIARYVRSFEMINKGSSTDYFLFFATNSQRGLAKMKEAMWRTDPTGDFQFSDATEGVGMMKLFNQPNYERLKGQILATYKGKSVSIEKLTEFVVENTEFLETHFKTPILKPMEEQNELTAELLARPRRKGTFPNGTIISFK